jgi:hypothetical protein
VWPHAITSEKSHVAAAVRMYLPCLRAQRTSFLARSLGLASGPQSTAVIIGAPRVVRAASLHMNESPVLLGCAAAH